MIDIAEPIDKKIYFTKDTELAIIKYIETTDYFEKSKIYSNEIKKPFEKIVENWIFKLQAWKYTDSYADLSNDTITFLCERLHKYINKNGKAFSYFSVIARNYLLLFIKKRHQKIKSNVDVDYIDIERDVITEEYYKEYIAETSNFIEEFIKYFDLHLAILFDNIKDIRIADSVIELFRSRDNIENFNKKALYILIRERSGLKTQLITKVINDIEIMYSILLKNFQINDKITLDPYKLRELARIKKLNRCDN